MALDPVCKMEVNESHSPSAEFEGQVYLFCCEACKQTFLKAPEKYIASTTQHSHDHHQGHHH